MLFKMIFMQCINLILYLSCIYWTKFIYFVAIHAEIIQMYLFSIKCKFYCIYTLSAYFIHVFT